MGGNGAWFKAWIKLHCHTLGATLTPVINCDTGAYQRHTEFCRFQRFWIQLLSRGITIAMELVGTEAGPMCGSTSIPTCQRSAMTLPRAGQDRADIGWPAKNVVRPVKIGFWSIEVCGLLIFLYLCVISGAIRGFDTRLL